MNLFDKMKDNIDILNKKMERLKKNNVLFMDVETEGKICGYDRASMEYKPKLYKLENEYKDLKRIIEQEKDMYASKCDDLLNRLYNLKKENNVMQSDLEIAAKKVSKTYDIPIDKIYESIKYGDIWEAFIFFNIFNPLNILGVIYSYKKKKFKKYEQKGYLEAKQIYEEEIKKLKEKLEILKNNGDKEIRELLILIIDILEEIANKKTTIVQLSSLL